MSYKAIILIVFTAYLERASASGCTISINNDIGDPQPLLLKPKFNYGNEAFYLPDNGDVINLSDGDIIRVGCPGGNVTLDGESTPNSLESAICNNGKFEISGKSLPFVALTCSSYPAHTARVTGNSCLENYKEIEIGFELNDGEFLKQIQICFDQNKDNTLFSVFNLTKTIGGYQVSFPRPGWLQGKFYSVSGVDTLYSRAKQRTTINSLLGLAATSYKYVASSGDLYLTRGHLTAKTDFLYGSQHRSTFYFINAVPQWQTFNAVNWGKLEDNVRAFASKNQKDLIVYTGSHGATTLKHETTGEDVMLYLSVNGDVKKIPIPQIVWKVVYEPANKLGVALLGVNNPYRTEDDLNKDIICPDISEQILWVTWNRTNLKNGYGYACTIGEFRKVINTLPDFEVKDLLI